MLQGVKGEPKLAFKNGGVMLGKNMRFYHLEHMSLNGPNANCREDLAKEDEVIENVYALLTGYVAT